MNCNYTDDAGFLHPAILEYFHHSSDKSGLKVADCTVQSAEYTGAFTVLWFSMDLPVPYGSSYSVCQLRARRALSLFKDVPLSTRRVLSVSPIVHYNKSSLLVFNGTSLNIDSALLALNWRSDPCFERMCVCSVAYIWWSFWKCTRWYLFSDMCNVLRHLSLDRAWLGGHVGGNLPAKCERMRGISQRSLIVIMICYHSDWNYSQGTCSAIWENHLRETPPDQDLNYRIEISLCDSSLYFVHTHAKIPWLVWTVITVIITITNLLSCENPLGPIS